MRRFLETEMTDFEFSEYLNSNGWVGSVNKPVVGDRALSEFIGPDNACIAKVVYNNVRLTRKIFLPNNRNK